jgi:hypothetical protein
MASLCTQSSIEQRPFHRGLRNGRIEQAAGGLPVVVQKEGYFGRDAPLSECEGAEDWDGADADELLAGGL